MVKSSLVPRPPHPALRLAVSDKSWAWRPWNKARSNYAVLFGWWPENRQLKSKLKWPKYIVMSVVIYGNVKLSGILVSCCQYAYYTVKQHGYHDIQTVADNMTSNDSNYGR